MSFSESGLEFAKTYAKLTALQMSQELFESEASNFDAVLVRFNTYVNKSAMKGDRLKAILSPTTGIDHIDMEYAKSKRIKVYHLRDQKKFLKTISSTAELTVGLMLSMYRNIPNAVSSVAEGNWSAALFRGKELSGKVFGIIGCGRLGSKVAKVAVALGMKVMAYDPYKTKLPAGVVRISSLDSLLAVSDIISLHIPLNAKTTHLIGSREISLMKSGALIINTSRGSVIDSMPLLEALKAKNISAALDVVEYENEVLAGNRNLLIDYARKNSNLIITPHMGGTTYEGIQKTDENILNRYFRDQGLIQ